MLHHVFLKVRPVLESPAADLADLRFFARMHALMDMQRRRALKRARTFCAAMARLQRALGFGVVACCRYVATDRTRLRMLLLYTQLSVHK